MSQTNYLCIAETGFGSGLNLLALMAEVRDPHLDLHVDFLSVEAHPLDEGQMAFVHEQFPELELMLRRCGRCCHCDGRASMSLRCLADV